MSENLAKIDASSLEIIDKVDPLIRALPPAQQQDVRRIVTTAIAYQGPLPPPEMLEQYGKIIANGPERMMALLEKQTDHRISMESQIVKSRVSITRNGQWMAFGLSVFFGVAAFYLGIEGYVWKLRGSHPLGRQPLRSSKPSDGVFSFAAPQRCPEFAFVPLAQLDFRQRRLHHRVQ